jgi:type IV secretory pathway TrbL component
MPIIQLILVLAVIGFLLWLVNNKIPMQDWIKTTLNVVVVIAVVVWLLKVFGIWSSLSTLQI